jgi:hypothetical protein
MSYQTNMRVLTAEKRSDFALLQQRARGKDATHRSRGGLRPSLTAPARAARRTAGRDEGMAVPVEQRDGQEADVAFASPPPQHGYP